MVTASDFDLSICPGQTTSAIIVCAGIGDISASCPTFEMRDSCQEAFGAQTHQLFVCDKARRWYQSEAGWQALIASITAYLSEHKIRHLAITGLSMGGYGALELSRALPDSLTSKLETFNVVALSTRTQLLPVPDFDGRNTSLIYNIESLRQPPLWQALSPHASYVCIFAIDEVEDTLHAWYIAERDDIHLMAAPGGHNIANNLRVAGKLTEFLRDLLSPCLVARLSETLGFFWPQPAHYALAIASHNGHPSDQQRIAATLPKPQRPSKF